MLKQLHINIPFAEALEQIPNYVTFFKDILANKIRLGKFETIALTQECIHMLQSKIPQELKDPKSFTISYSIETRYNGRALCDLRGQHQSHAPIGVQTIGSGRMQTNNSDSTAG